MWLESFDKQVLWFELKYIEWLRGVACVGWSWQG